MNNYAQLFAKNMRLAMQSVLFALVLAEAIYLPVALQKGLLTVPTNVLPALHANQTSAAPVVTPLAKVARPTVNHGATPWGYDFSTFPNGPVRHADWNFENGTSVADYNNEAQAYTSRPKNVRIENGALVIEALPETKDGKQYTSARINTKGKFEFTYGTLEVTMMLPSGEGTWPAAWLLPAENKYSPGQFGISSTNPYGWALNGEIDFAEAIGSIPGQNIPAIHSYNEVQRSPTYTPGYVPDSATTYHRYGVIKTPTSISFTIDGKPFNTRYKTSNNPLEWPYDQPYYLVLDLALGGSWAGAHGIDNSTAPWELKIKSISYRPL